MTKDICIKKANENNLKNMSVTIPRDKMVVITGISGSGKSSLAFDTIYAEGQRRYIESLSSYARQFLGQMEKPDVEMIEGLSPAISIDQKTTGRNPRSTVGTVTEIYDYLRLMYARIGTAHCPECGREIRSQSIDQIVDALMAEGEGVKLTIFAPVIRGRKGTHEKVIGRIRKEGFTRVRIDEEIYRLDDDEISIEKTRKHNIDIVVDRVKVKEGVEGRLAEACEIAVSEVGDLVTAEIDKGSGGKETKTFSTRLACPEHGISIEELEPRMFSFNAPYGACPECNGLGFIHKIDPEKVIDYSKSIINGALSKVFASMEYTGYYRQVIQVIADRYGADLTKPFGKQPKKFIDDVLYGTGTRRLKYEYRNRTGTSVRHMNHTFEGVLNNIERRYRETRSEFIKERLSAYMSISECAACGGKRLKPEVLAVTVGGLNISELCDMSVTEAIDFTGALVLSDKQKLIAKQILKEIKSRLNFLADVGLDYLTLSRSGGTLSGGESQRIRLATQIGSSLVGVLYILDEPSIGLHQKDNAMLLKTLRGLTDLGNTLLIVEHDEDTMYAADQIIDIGPGAGSRGGRLVAQGTVEDIKVEPGSITGQYLSGKKKIPVPSERRSGNGSRIRIEGAAANNLKNIDVDFPLGKFICVTGVSGSGKSSLVNEIMYKGISAAVSNSKVKAGPHKNISGIENIDKVINIDQSPIGRTPRSNLATYTKVFDHMRDIFSQIPEAKLRGYRKGRFSFNVKGGRCESCRGDGIIKIEMHFLPDVYVPCEVCKGRRYNRETLEVKYRGRSIFDVLDMTVSEALDFFRHIPQIKRQLDTLDQVGLGYIKLGQPSTQLSGGEAQRIKLARELSNRGSGKTLYILDEPTTGLHFADIDKLMHVIDCLTDTGNTVVVIEHNLDVIKCADHIIDLGPDGGSRGGEIIAEGTPEHVASIKESYTGKYLKRVLEK